MVRRAETAGKRAAGAMRVVLLGAPGSGKGTQAQRLMADHGWPQISTGDLLRKAVASGSELGKRATATMDAGELVSDELVLGIIRERVARDDCRDGFVLDGFPRNLAQAKGLEPVLAEISQLLDVAVLLDVDFDVLMQRLTGRRTCSITGKLLNIYCSPQSEIDACIDAGGELIQRADDNEETIGNRLKVYRAQTSPLAKHYGDADLLRVVDGNGKVDTIYQRLLESLELNGT